MQAKIKPQAKMYAHILSRLFMAQNIPGNLAVCNRGARYLNLGVRLADPRHIGKSLRLAESLALASNSETVIASRQRGIVFYQYQLHESLWEWYTRADVAPSEIGIASKRRPVTFSLDDAPHSLFGGTTGSGKTQAIISAMMVLCNLHTPDDARFIIIDTNQELSDFHNSAYLLRPIATDFNGSHAALLHADKMLNQRKAQNQKDGQKVIVVLDEVSDVSHAPECVEILKNIAKQGRKYQVHLIIGTQRTGQKELPGIFDLLLNRLIGQTNNAQTSAILTGHAGLQAHKLTGKGDFLHINGASVQRFQVAQATSQDFDALERAETPKEPPIVLPSVPQPPTQTRGRPKTTIEPEPLAYYLHHTPDKISIAQAQRALGFAKSKHNLYKQFVTQLKVEFQRLQREAK